MSDTDMTVAKQREEVRKRMEDNFLDVLDAVEARYAQALRSGALNDTAWEAVRETLDIPQLERRLVAEWNFALQELWAAWKQ